MPKKKESEDEMTEEMRSDIVSLDETITNIEQTLAPFFKTPCKETLSKLSELEAAKLQVAMAYAINTLIFLYLKTEGVSPSDHPVKAELDRIRSYFKKVKDLSEKENPSKRTLVVNKDAAARFINHALNENPTDQQQQPQQTHNDENIDSNNINKNNKQDKKQKEVTHKDSTHKVSKQTKQNNVSPSSSSEVIRKKKVREEISGSSGGEDVKQQKKRRK